jgi:hypothetical protein
MRYASTPGKRQRTVRRWRCRFQAKGVEGLLREANAPPHHKLLTAEKIAKMVHTTLR